MSDTMLAIALGEFVVIMVMSIYILSLRSRLELWKKRAGPRYLTGHK